MVLLRLIFAILFAPIRWLTNPITRPKNSLLEWHLSYGPFFVKIQTNQNKMGTKMGTLVQIQLCISKEKILPAVR
jgi:hypothetical protein